MPGKDCFNFFKLNAEPTNFYLLIDASQKLNPAIRQIAAEITGFIKARIRVAAKRMADKLLGS